MASRAQGQDHGEPASLRISQPQSVQPALQPMAANDQPSGDAKGALSTRALQEPAGDRGRMELPLQSENQDAHQEREDAGRRTLLRRHPLAFGIGLVLLALATAAGYVYWDYADHFESTDDAFIAARQFAIAPKVSGYITAIPVTDN